MQYDLTWIKPCDAEMPSLLIFTEFSWFSTWFPVFRITLSILQIFHISLLFQTYINITLFNTCAIINFSQKSLKRPPIGV